MKLLLVGDMHGVQPALVRAINLAAEWELDAVFQVGDFGYWPRSGTSKNSFIAIAAESPVPVYWLPGNHEDWDDYEAVLEALERDENGFGIWGNMRISPKVHSWAWDGWRFGVLGGAYSVDRSMRTLGQSYFEQELPEFEDVDLLPEKVDILLTHEAPLNLARVHGWGPLPKAWNVDWELSNQSQTVVWMAVQKTKPGLLVHGHWHIRINYFVPDSDTFCQGLDQASGGDPINCMMVLDTEKRALYDLYQFKVEGTRPQWQGS